MKADLLLGERIQKPEVRCQRREDGGEMADVKERLMYSNKKPLTECQGLNFSIDHGLKNLWT